MPPVRIFRCQIHLIFLVISLACIVYLCGRRQDLTTCFQGQMKGPLMPDNPQLIEEVKQKYLDPPSRLPYDLQADKKSSQALVYSQHTLGLSFMFLQEIIHELFPNKRNGFFVEAGALDGEYWSNTLDLERHYQWTGLLVEPDGQMYRHLLEKHRRSWSSHTCLSSKPYPYKASLSIVDSPSAVLEVWGFATRGFNALFESPDVEMRSKHGYLLLEEVQCIPLQTLLFALNVTRVDLVSLDVEDTEIGILTHFPFDSIIVDVWLVEHRHPGTHLDTEDEIDNNFVKWFDEKGFALYKVGDISPKDYIFLRKQSEVYRRVFKPLHIIK